LLSVEFDYSNVSGLRQPLFIFAFLLFFCLVNHLYVLMYPGEDLADVTDEDA